MSQIRKDVFGVLKGLQMVASEGTKMHENYATHLWKNSSVKSVLEGAGVELKSRVTSLSPESCAKSAKEGLQRSSMIFEGIKAFTSYVANANTPKGRPEKEASLSEFDILEQDIINPNNPMEGMIGFESSGLPRDASSDQVVGLQVGTVISSKGIAAQAVFKSVPLETSPTRKVRPSLSDIAELHPITSAPTELKSREEQLAKVSPVEPQKPVQDQAIIPTGPNKFKQSLSGVARERRVPASRLGRMLSFGGLAAGLGLGTVAEAARRSLGFESNSNLFVTPANAERIVNTLCKVRGAALKIGQLLSIQDNNIIDPALQKAFERVRQSADFMPQSQVESVLRAELGPDWRAKFAEFEMSPFAAASIGQVHQGKLFDGSLVAVKIQYPGVAQGIDSDIENLVGVLSLWNVFPEGMFVDKMVEVAKKELGWEVDYVREAECTRKFRKLLAPYPDYYVPKVIDDMSTGKVFTSELIEGVPVDRCADLDEGTRTRICTLILNLCLRELFQWRYMQTDPNWSNFFYNTDTGKLILLDFGATRSYDKAFMDQYIEIVKAGADNDRKRVLHISRDMGFLTGFESKAMEKAHVDTVMILAEQFREGKGAFDFSRQDATLRVTQLVPTILTHRLCPPPEEIYSLHRRGLKMMSSHRKRTPTVLDSQPVTTVSTDRATQRNSCIDSYDQRSYNRRAQDSLKFYVRCRKLSGVFLLCAKMKVKLHCRPMFMEVYNNYKFG